MTSATGPAAPQPAGVLFQRVPVAAHDERVFVAKLVVVSVLALVGAHLALRHNWPSTLAGVLLLGAVYTHAVELQHQCLHHSAFRRPGVHRPVGILLGLPMLVSHSHYQVRHLQHHRWLGTPRDSEFFGFDTRQPITFRSLLRGLLDFPRLSTVLVDIVRCYRGTWSYGTGQIGPRQRRRIIAEYRAMGVVIVAVAVAMAMFGGGWPVARLWLLPLLVAVPAHFLVELPEHVLCDTDSTDVLRNTRSIRGSRLSTWFTNSNNLHIEHHAAMMVPPNQLPGRHEETRRLAVHVERSYPDFFRLVLREARVGRRG